MILLFKNSDSGARKFQNRNTAKKPWNFTSEKKNTTNKISFKFAAWKSWMPESGDGDWMDRSPIACGLVGVPWKGWVAGGSTLNSSHNPFPSARDVSMFLYTTSLDATTSFATVVEGLANTALRSATVSFRPRRSRDRRLKDSSRASETLLRVLTSKLVASVSSRSVSFLSA